MSVPTSLPSVDECASLYRQISRDFPDDWFTVEELRVRLLQGGYDDHSEERDDLGYLLSLLVAYGLLDRDEQDRYRVRCKPGESSARWHARIEPNVEAIHRSVHESDGTERPSLPRGGGGSRIPHGGATYREIAVESDTEFPDLLAELTTVLERNPDLANVVLTAPATEMGAVQRFADRLYDAEAMSETGCTHRFEKDDSDVVGEDKDDLEYRLYLTGESL